MGAPDTSEPEPELQPAALTSSGRELRRIGTAAARWLLVFVSGLALTLSITLGIARTTLGDRDRFAAAVDGFLSDPEVQDDLANLVSAEAEKLTPIVKPYHTTVSHVARLIIVNTAFREVTVRSLSQLQADLLGSDATKVTLKVDASAALRDVVREIDPELVADLPSKPLLIKIARIPDDGVRQVPTAYGVLLPSVIGMLVVALLAGAGAIALSPRRWLTLAGIFGVAGIVAFSLTSADAAAVKDQVLSRSANPLRAAIVTTALDGVDDVFSRGLIWLALVAMALAGILIVAMVVTTRSSSRTHPVDTTVD